jgi:hypothetical protein
VHKAVELDEAKRAEGSDLDEFQAHRFLEFFKETLTVQAMRDKLRSTGAIVGQVKRIPLTHLFIFKYNADWHTLVNAPQVRTLHTVTSDCSPRPPPAIKTAC